MKTKTIKSLNIEAGGCNADEQSTADVTIHAVNDPNTKDVDERTECNFQCKEGYFDEKKGDKKIVKVSFPDEYGNKDLAGKKAEFECKINKVSKSIKPEVNDELAKKFGLEKK